MNKPTTAERMEIASHVFLGSSLNQIARHYGISVAEVKAITGIE